MIYVFKVELDQFETFKDVDDLSHALKSFPERFFQNPEERFFAVEGNLVEVIGSVVESNIRIEITGSDARSVIWVPKPEEVLEEDAE